MHALHDLRDDTLVALAVQGDIAAFSMLASRYRARAMRVAYGILHNRADAEDAVQEAFIRVCRHLPGFRRAGRFASWVYQVVVNESLRLLRARSGRRDQAEVDARHISFGKADTVHTLMVRQCLAALPGKLRVVLALRGLEELDYAEIAAILGIPLGTVRSRLHEARRLFAKHWKEAMKDEM